MPILSDLFTARPTAVNLGAATRRLEGCLDDAIAAGRDACQIARDLIAEGKAIAEEDIGRNKAMAKWGGDWLIQRIIEHGGDGNNLNVLTVCNTGSLATSVRLPLHPVCPLSAALVIIGIRHSPRFDHLPL